MLISKVGLREEVIEFINTVKEFCEREFKDTLEWDAQEYMPHDLWKKMGDIGLTGMMLDADLGGLGDDLLTSVVIHEEMSVYSPAIAMTLGAHAILAGNVINRGGNKKQKEKYIPPIASGDKVAAICITEPEIGSDAAHPRTRAIKKGDRYILKGNKIFITNGPIADIFVVYARTSDDPKRGVSAFIVEKDFGNISVEKMHKMGMRASPTGFVTFNDTEVPEENLLRAEGEGIHIMMEGLDVERIGLSGSNLGMIKGSLDIASKYAKERMQFGQPIIDYQLIQEKLAYILSQLELNRLYLYNLAEIWRKYPGSKKLRAATALVKMTSAQAAVKSAEEAIQILGGYGYTTDYRVQMYWRDAKLYDIGAGTTEMMKILLSRRIEEGFADL
ncbi:Butyryl-CoA dehydrogenase [Desulfurella amilsii]|uniref:Butyryl-CoA dehydrogenase n=1 Tax=Desulfurella amilsii TaxID=1562698 RepID=A0A1X4XUN0_9BACT|nr:acyl-CoA dehydrogenase family protein [Desulfurella amilsii]OSS41239.1 Butyryl-CoA dehydrogenase [Desulfurella amilsii]